MIPLIAGAAAIAIVSGVSQYLSSAEAQRLSKKEREKLEKLVRDAQSPTFNTADIDPETFAVVAKYKPEVADFIQEQAPELTKMDSADAKLSREAQREALNRLRSQAEGNDPLARAELSDALARASVNNRGRTDAVREDFARRGQGGGAAEMLAQLLGTQQTNELAADNSRQAYIEAQRRRLQAMRDSAGLAGQIRDDEYQLERGNNDLINSFNQRVATRKQDWANNVANVHNDAQKFNITNEQDVANRNTNTANQFKVGNRDRENDAAQRMFQNEMSKINTLSGVTNMARDDARNDARDRNSAISGAADGAQTALSYGASSSSGQQSQAPATQGVTAQEDVNDFNNPLNRRYRTGRAYA